MFLTSIIVFTLLFGLLNHFCFCYGIDGYAKEHNYAKYKNNLFIIFVRYQYENTNSLQNFNKGKNNERKISKESKYSISKLSFWLQIVNYLLIVSTIVANILNETIISDNGILNFISRLSFVLLLIYFLSLTTLLIRYNAVSHNETLKNKKRKQ